jgi:hypothetical protein
LNDVAVVNAPMAEDCAGPQSSTSRDYVGLKSSTSRDYAGLNTSSSTDYVGLKSSPSAPAARGASSPSYASARASTSTGRFEAYTARNAKFGNFAAASGEYIGFKTSLEPERESDVSWRVVESDRRASRLSLPNVSLLAFASSTRSRLSGFGPRLELVAAGCIAAFAGYGVTAWTCDLSETKARAAHSGESVLTGAAVLPALEVARAATWALANPDAAAVTTLAFANQAALRGIVPVHSVQNSRGRRGAAPAPAPATITSTTSAKRSTAARSLPSAVGLASQAAQKSRVSPAHRVEAVPLPAERMQADLIAMALADKRAPGGTGSIRATEGVAPMRREEWQELARLVAPAESAQAEAPAHALQGASIASAPHAHASVHAPEAARVVDSQVDPLNEAQPAAAKPQEAPTVPLGVFRAAPQQLSGAALASPSHAVLQNIDVRGPLPKSIIRRSLGRLEGEFTQCASICARSADACVTGLWHAETVLDEAGRSRDPRVSGPPSGSQLSECITKATSRLAILAPDTGTVRVSWDVKFTP